MKKNEHRRMTLLLSAAVLTIGMAAAVGLTGCGSGDEQATEPATEATEAATETTAATEATTAAPEPTAAPTTAGGEIGEAKALEIALKDAGLSESEVTSSNVHLDYDDGRTEYEVKFIKGDMEYEYNIDAVNGTITEKSAESVYD